MSDTLQPAPRILIVDDEEMIRENLGDFFEDEGFEIFLAESGEEALEIMGREKIDAGIFDMRLRGIDGNALILLAHKIQPEMKKVVYTGSTTYRVPPEVEIVGITMDQVFQKPISDMGLLLDCIQRLLKEGAP